MIVKSGRIVIKERVYGARSFVVPQSYTVNKNTEAFIGYETALFPYTLNPISDRIIYTLGPKRFNQCIHTRIGTSFEGDPMTPHVVTYLPLPDDRKTYWYSFPSANEAHTSAVALAWSSFGTSQFLPGYNGKNANDLAVEGFSRMRPDLTKVSLPNFLIDIKQLRDLFRIFESRARSFRGGSLSLRRLKAASKNIAGANLNARFGWLPTISDLEGMVDAITNTRDVLAKWQTLLNTVVQDKCTLAKGSSLTSSGSFGLHGNSNYPVYWQASIEGSIQAFIRYRPLPLQAMNDLDLQLRAFQDALGIELNPRIIWDAIPFSFVVDWFLTIGNFLDRFKLDTLELPIKLEDFCLQFVNTKSVGSYMVESLSGSPVTPPYRTPGWLTQEHKFWRMPIFPDEASLASLNWKFPSLNQAVLGLSLGVALGLK